MNRYSTPDEVMENHPDFSRYTTTDLLRKHIHQFFPGQPDVDDMHHEALVSLIHELSTKAMETL